MGDPLLPSVEFQNEPRWPRVKGLEESDIRGAILPHRWNRATRMIVLRLRAKQRMFFGMMQSGVKAVSFLSSGVLGPQLSLVFNLAPPQLPSRGHGPRPHAEPADLQIEVCSSQIPCITLVIIFPCEL